MNTLAERDAALAAKEQENTELRRDCEETTRMHLTFKQRELDKALDRAEAAELRAEALKREVETWRDIARSRKDAVMIDTITALEAELLVARDAVLTEGDRAEALATAVEKYLRKTVSAHEYLQLRHMPKAGQVACLAVGEHGLTCQWVAGHYGPHNRYSALETIDEMWGGDEVTYRTDRENALRAALDAHRAEAPKSGDAHAAGT